MIQLTRLVRVFFRLDFSSNCRCVRTLLVFLPIKYFTKRP